MEAGCRGPNAGAYVIFNGFPIAEEGMIQHICTCFVINIF